MRKFQSTFLLLLVLVAAIVAGRPLTAEAVPLVVSSTVVNAKAAEKKLPPYTTVVNKEKTSQNYLHSKTEYKVDEKTVLTIDLYYRLQKDGSYKAVYYNAVSADGAISFSERDIYDDVTYVDDNDLGLKKGQVVDTEIKALLKEVGY